MPKGWRTTSSDAVRLGRGKVYALCLADRMRARSARRDLFASPSLRYADPRRGLLDGAAWEAARPTVCRTLGVAATAGEELTGWRASRPAFRATIANLPANAAVRIERTATAPTLVLSPARQARRTAPAWSRCGTAVAARLPRVDLPELLLEIHARTGFADDFTHASEAEARARGPRHQHLRRARRRSLQHRARAAGPPRRPGAAPLRLSWVRRTTSAPRP